MKKTLILLVSLLTAISLSLGGFFFWWQENIKPVSLDSKKTRVVIEKGRSASEVANILKNKNLIRNPLIFKFYLQVFGNSQKIQSGEFELSENMGLYQVVEELLKGPKEIWVTIPEGLRREEAVEKIISGLGLEGEKAVSFRKEFLAMTVKDEGYLFPDTYLYPKDVKVSIVVSKLKKTFDEKVKALTQNPTSESYSLSQKVVLASIIERETKTESEREVVAGIYYKRLEAGWPLQADAAVQYAVSSAKCKAQSAKCDWWPILTNEDLEIASPYNTYKNKGLPPSPIASPGASSIKAVFAPLESPYWYYIHDKEGKIHFARSIEEHNANVSKYLGR